MWPLSGTTICLPRVERWASLHLKHVDPQVVLRIHLFLGQQSVRVVWLARGENDRVEDRQSARLGASLLHTLIANFVF